MKKSVLFIALIAAMFASCSKEELPIINSTTASGIKLNITVGNLDPNATRAAIKTGWSTNDQILIWYDDNTDANPDLAIKYNGSQWINDAGVTVSGNDPAAGEGKYAKAVYNNGVAATATKPYTYSDNTLNIDFDTWSFLTGIQLVVTGVDEAATNYTLACDRFTPYTGYTVGASSITATAADKGAAATGFENSNNLSSACFTFVSSDLWDENGEYNFTLTATTAGTKYYKTTDNIASSSSIKGLKIALSKFAADPNMLPGVFSVAADKQVHFSKGNLYWNGSTFNFEENQYSFATEWDPSHVSHFYWSKTASVAYAEDYSDVAAAESDILFTNKSDDATKANPSFTVNGSTGIWRTLTTKEWQYLLHTRGEGETYFKYGVEVCGINCCLVIAPDGNSTEIAGSYTPEQWATAEANGFVCLPASGYRYGNYLSFTPFSSDASYWSSSADDSDMEEALGIYSDILFIDYRYYSYRYYGLSVRLIRE